MLCDYNLKAHCSSNAPSLLTGYVVPIIISTMGISDSLIIPRYWNMLGTSRVHAQPSSYMPSHITPCSYAGALYLCENSLCASVKVLSVIL